MKGNRSEDYDLLQRGTQKPSVGVPVRMVRIHPLSLIIPWILST